jgi:hypothetical protein
MTREEVAAYLTSLAKELAQANPIAPTAKSLGKTKISSQAFTSVLLKNEKIAISEVMTNVVDEIKVNNKDFKIYVEVFNEDKLAALAKSSDIQLINSGVTVDEGYYWDGVVEEVTVPVYLSTSEDGSTGVITEYWDLPYASDIDDIDDIFNVAVDAKMAELPYPLFVVTMEENSVELVAKDSPELGKVNAGPYLVLKGINLKVKRDWWNEELELWYGSPVEIYAGYESQTIIKNGWKFNGNRRIDASGVSRYFSDVNKKDKWYADQGYDVRLMALDTKNKRMVAWENDWNSGQIDRVMIIPNTLDPSSGATIRGHISNYDAWNLNTNTVNTHVEMISKIDGDWFQSLLDQDDRYSQSGVYKITDANVRALSINGTFESQNAVSGGLGDIKYKFAWSAN